MTFHVFVNSMNKYPSGSGIIVEASNGSPDGPPFVRFQLPNDKVKECHIGKSYVVTIEETSNG